MKISQSIGSREKQEDGYFKFYFRNYIIIGIIDGHGGDSLMNDLRRNYCNYLEKFLSKKELILNTEHFNDYIKDFYIFLDLLYIKKKIESGCCLSVLFLDKDENKINLVQLGDTKIILFDKFKNFICQTSEHRLDNKYELNRICKIEGNKNIRIVHGILRYKSLMISRVLGDYSYKNISMTRENDPLSSIPEIFTVNMTDKIYCLLITDGIYDLIGVDTILNSIRKYNFREFHNYIFNECNNVDKARDNITIITEIFQKKYIKKTS